MIRNRSRSSPQASACVLALLLAAGMDAGSARSDESETGNTYLFDSSRDRSPAITEFPKYPYVARRDRIEGEATVCFTINRRGEVVRPSVRRSSHRIFRRPALKAIRKSTFEPLAPDDALSGVKTCRTYRFKLDPVLADAKE